MIGLLGKRGRNRRINHRASLSGSNVRRGAQSIYARCPATVLFWTHYLCSLFLFSHLAPLLRQSPVPVFQNRSSRTGALPFAFGSVSQIYLGARHHRDRNVQVGTLFPGVPSFTPRPLPFIRKSTYSTGARVISTTTSQSRVGTRYERAPGWKAPLARTSRLGPFQLCADDRQPLPTALVLRGTLRLFCRERSQRAGACVHLL
jgi:hypothetical protein